MTDLKSSSAPTILLLSSADSDRNVQLNDRFVLKLNQQLGGKCNVTWSNYRNIGFYLGTRQLEPFIISDRKPLSNFQAVYFKSYFRFQEQAVCIAEALAKYNIPFVGKELLRYVPAFKLSQMARMAQAGLPIPDSLYLSSEHCIANFDLIVQTCGSPFIFKVIDGKGGDDNYLVRDKAQLETILRSTPDRHFVAQRFIANEYDLRVLLVNGAIQLVIERRRQTTDTHLNNTSKGASARLVAIEEFDPALQRLAIKAAGTIGRDIAGVDLMLESGTGNPYILEVNASPQIGSGAFEAEKVVVFAQFLEGLAHDRA